MFDPVQHAALVLAVDALEARMRWYEQRPFISLRHPSYVRLRTARRILLRMVSEMERQHG